MYKQHHMLQVPKLPFLQNAVHRTVPYHLTAAGLLRSTDLWNVHGSYHPLSGAVSDNACVRLLPDYRKILLFFRHEALLYHLLRLEHLSRVFYVLCVRTSILILPEVIHLYVLPQTHPILSLHSHWQGLRYP